MNVTYEREVGHCSPTRYVKEYTVNQVVPADNSDNLDIIRFDGNWFQAVVKRGVYNVGDSVFFIPPETVLPFELSEEMGITKYLGKGRVKEARLRGNLSQGIVADKAIVEPYLPYLMQWEDLPTTGMSGDPLLNAEIPMEFVKFYKMPSLKNEPDTFEIGEPVFYSEKIHGTNGRGGIFRNPVTGEWQLYVGSHERVLRESDDNIYWQAMRNALEKAKKDLPYNVELFFEVYGTIVQGGKFGYDLPAGMFKLRVFNAYTVAANPYTSVYTQGYMNIGNVKLMCDDIGLETVNFYEDTFQGKEWAESLADEPSEFGNIVREGIVIVSAVNPNKMAKFISSKYLALKGRKERH